MDAEIQLISARQHQVVGYGQLRRAWIGDGAIRQRVARGWLVPVHRGVFAVSRAELTFHGRCSAATLYCGRGAAVSHVSAGGLHGASSKHGGAIHVSSGRHIRPTPGVVVHRRRSFPLSCWGHIDGMRCATGTARGRD